MTSRMARLARRELRARDSIALISSGGHTFTVERSFLPPVDDPIEIYWIAVPKEEGEIRIVRCGLLNHGPFGVEFSWRGQVALPVERALWWVHALHATTRLAEALNRREDRLN